MDELIKNLLEYIKRKNNFPPRDRASKLLELSGGVLSRPEKRREMARACLDSIQKVLEEVTTTLISEADQLGLTAEDKLLTTVNDACQNVFTEARGFIASLRVKPDDRDHLLAGINEEFSNTYNHLVNRVKLRKLNIGDKPITSIQVSGGQIGNLVVGHVNQSSLNASVHQIIERGGNEAELGRLIEQLIDAVDQMDARDKSNQTELYDLIKGVVHQIKLPNEERSPSMLRVAWDRIVDLSKVSAQATQVVQQMLPQVLGLIQSVR